jgi:hypothetical protein
MLEQRFKVCHSRILVISSIPAVGVGVKSKKFFKNGNGAHKAFPLL